MKIFFCSRQIKHIRRFSLTIPKYEKSVIKIGNVERVVDSSQHSVLVPSGFLPSQHNRTLLRHLQWMLQKDNLGQDMFLMGPPGSYRRRLTMAFAELTHREVEYVSLSRDTTESDLKQRREIVKGSAVYIDQSALRAALHGRILVLDGIEKTERNVLPILNNLLENREMQLEDGRFLMRSQLFNELLTKYSQAQLDRWKFLKCDENFRVVALGLPVPKFKGNPLDPPLRSRFQSRFVDNDSYEEILDGIKDKFPTINMEKVAKIVSFIHALRSHNTLDVEIPFFSLDRLTDTIGMLENIPELNESLLIEWLYPYGAICNDASKKVIKELFQKFEIKDNKKVSFKIQSVNDNSVDLLVSDNSVWKSGSKRSIKIQSGKMDSFSDFLVLTKNLENVLAEMAISHSLGDFCVVGTQGSGKSTIVESLANRLGFTVTNIVLYGDMTSRELLQQRDTAQDTGDTIWRNSALVRAALEGEWAVLGGLHRLEKGCVALLSQLIADRQLQLFDGSRLLRDDRYQLLKISCGLTDDEMAQCGLYRIHPNFRLIALAEPPSIPGETHTSISPNRVDWLTPEIMSTFRFHFLPEVTKDDEMRIVTELIPNIQKEKIITLLNIVHKLRTSEDSQLRDSSYNLSVRQILRISRRLARYPNLTVVSAVRRACLSKFLPKLVQNSLSQVLEEFDSSNSISDAIHNSDSEELKKLVDYYLVNLHPNANAIVTGEEEAKIPNTLFYESVAHTRILLEMLQDFIMGYECADKQHLLLIGNQGVGKNKIVDRFLHILKRPREYIQLHRDTTVQTLTMQPTIVDGRLIYEDSPLVKAISKGHVLVVDEADKASTQVTCILKNLLILGDMELSDGRRIIPEYRDTSKLSASQKSKVIPIHPHFRMIVLANRPGFPFLGNDFFGAMGDVFSCHIVDNPDIISEIEMLQKYGPSVPPDTVKKLVFLFSDLRDLADQGQIQYPYSTREVVNIVKHLEKYPNDALSTVLSNVFDFDVSNKEMFSTLETTLEKHGIALPGSQVKVSLAKELNLPNFEKVMEWRIASTVKNLQLSVFKGEIKTSADLNRIPVKIETHITRSRIFTELDENVSVNLGNYNLISDFISSFSGESSNHSNVYLHIVTLNPIMLTTITLPKDHSGSFNSLSSCKSASQMDLSEIFPPVQGSFRPNIRLASLPPPLESSLLFHEASSNVLLQIDTASGNVKRLACDDCIPEFKVKFVAPWSSARDSSKMHREFFNMYNEYSSDSTDSFVVFQRPGDNCLHVFNVIGGQWHKVSLDFPLQNIYMLSKDQWILRSTSKRSYILSRTEGNGFQYMIQHVETRDKFFSSDRILPDLIQSNDVHTELQHGIAKNGLALGTGSHNFVEIFPKKAFHNVDYEILGIPRSFSLSKSFLHRSSNSTFVPSSGVLVNIIDKEFVPKQYKNSDASKTSVSGFLEVINLRQKTIKYLQIPSVFEEPVIFSWLKHNIPDVFLVRLQSDIITVDNSGCINKWTVCPIKLYNELSEWKRNIGVGSTNNRDLMIERQEGDVDKSLDFPKHGKVDPTGAPHVGGNTWAGGTGGRDTAGLGGFGGPYRLDAGHDVYQVPDSVKATVPEHIRNAAREVAEKAWKQRLQQIRMSELDYDLYMRYYKKVEPQIGSIKVLLDTLQATSKERQWVRHKSQGDFDDGKLVEGVLGEKTIYRARGDKDPEPGAPQQKPKRLRVVVDVSGSMYRFNGHDQRMERQLEAILMLMESFTHANKNKLVYDIHGHSGEGSKFEFVNIDKVPSNEKQRMDVLSEMLAHSQFCLSGDHTLEAIDVAIKDLNKTVDDMDQTFLIILSDANLSRYGIPASSIAKLLLRDKDVQSYIIFIGSLGDQARVLNKALPQGHAFICSETADLPQILRNVFTTNLIN